MKHIITTVIITISIMISAPIMAMEKTADNIRLYRLDCGEIHVSDLNVFSDTYQYVGQKKDLTVSCYLIKKDDKWILWDTGLQDALSDNIDGKTSGAFTLKVKNRLEDQLKLLDLTPLDITHIGISHAHFDHTGNANMFKNAKLIMQEAEYNILTKTPDLAKKYYMATEFLSHFIGEKNKDNQMVITGDSDLFGDGSMRAITLTGHTPGHMALLVTLPETGRVILSGDQWHFQENRDNNGVPSFNYDRADTLASSDKLNQIIKNTGAKLIIQHEIKNKNIIPALPKFLK